MVIDVDIDEADCVIVEFVKDGGALLTVIPVVVVVIGFTVELLLLIALVLSTVFSVVNVSIARVVVLVTVGNPECLDDIFDTGVVDLDLLIVTSEVSVLVLKDDTVFLLVSDRTGVHVDIVVDFGNVDRLLSEFLVVTTPLVSSVGTINDGDVDVAFTPSILDDTDIPMGALVVERFPWDNISMDELPSFSS